MNSDKHNDIFLTQTKEQREKFQALLEKHQGDQKALMVLLQQSQEIYGFLPLEVQKKVAECIGVSLEKVYGVVSFYSLFTTEPKGKFNFSVCMGTACYVKGAFDIMEKLKDILQIGEGECSKDGLFSIMPTRCIGTCGLAPVMTVNHDVYGKIKPSDIRGIIEKYIELKEI